jgi:hypothetical protein
MTKSDGGEISAGNVGGMLVRRGGVGRNNKKVGGYSYEMIVQRCEIVWFSVSVMQWSKMWSINAVLV